MTAKTRKKAVEAAANIASRYHIAHKHIGALVAEIEDTAVRPVADPLEKALDMLLGAYLHRTTHEPKEGFVTANKDVVAEARAALAAYRGDRK